MPVGIVEGSRNLSYDRQVAILPGEYEVPTAPARVTANFLYLVLNKKYLDTDSSRTRDKSISRRVWVCYDSRGLNVGIFTDDANNNIGVSASLKLP